MSIGRRWDKRARAHRLARRKKGLDQMAEDFARPLAQLRRRLAAGRNSRSKSLNRLYYFGMRLGLFAPGRAQAAR